MQIRRLIRKQPRGLRHRLMPGLHLFVLASVTVCLAAVVTSGRGQDAEEKVVAEEAKAEKDEKAKKSEEKAESPASFDASVKVPVGMAVEFPVDI